MSGGPVLDDDDRVIGFNSGSSAPTGSHPGWDPFAAGVAAALELNFLPPTLEPEDAPPTDDDRGIEARTVQFAHLVATGAVDCDMFDSFHVDETTGRAGYLPRPG
jgi:hypothetical protein